MGPANQHIVFGPFDHQVLGKSIGLNLFSQSDAICRNGCAFCHLNQQPSTHPLPEPYEIVEQLIEFLQIKGNESKPLDCIIVTGGGDPTMHPKFEEIIKDVILVRDLISTETRIGVFTNGKGLHRPNVIESLQRVDLCILKVDPLQESTQHERLIDVEMASNIADLSSLRTKLILQSCLTENDREEPNVSKSREKEVAAISMFKPKKAFLCSSRKDLSSSNVPFLPLRQLEMVQRKLIEQNIPAFIL